MFIQVISGKVVDAEGFRREEERWVAELRPGATGFLGSTSGITSDTRFLVTARFDSAESARRNSDRPEQGAWWSDFEKTVSDVVFHDCSKVVTMLGGGSDDAKFVQVMRGHVKDRAAVDRIEARRDDLERVIRDARPDILGETICYHDDGDGYTDVVYFTSEADARAGEKDFPTGEAKVLLDELMQAVDIEEFLDFKNLNMI
ncbi:MAG TPA: hypothetical protein VEP49_04135 [Acidimicrobiia bacterium]|nr:hypothetical protein [Acidimicrobiia bacterium]